MIEKKLPLISVVVITYRRFGLLKQTIESFQSHCKYPNLEYILCDDGSSREIQEKMLALPFDRFLMGKENMGLGHNTNKGILDAKGEYIFQIQDDWIVNPRLTLTNYQENFIVAALEVFKERPDIYLVRYWPWEEHIVPRCDLFVTNNGIEFKVFKNKVVPLEMQKDIKNYLLVYSDRPHIKRRSFHEKLGLYKEGVHMTVVEGEFCKRFENQTKVKMAQLEGFHIFAHTGRGESLRRIDPYYPNRGKS